MRGRVVQRWARVTPAALRLAAGLATASALHALAAAPVAGLTAAETAAIVALGPWPPPAARDPGNRVSGQADAIELGQRLFFDSRLSPVGYIGCVTCHQPDRGWTDLKQRAHGLADLERNTQPLNNLRLQRWFGWGGSSDSLWMASIRPILDSREMDSSAAHVRHLYLRVPEYACLYRRVFGVDAFAAARSDEAVLVDTAKALAAYVETLSTDRTPFDALRDALARGDPLPPYPAAALRGLRQFVGAGRCVACHGGPDFSDGEFHDTAVPRYVAQRSPDPGREDGIAHLRSSRFTLLGPYNDDVTRANAAATQALPPAAPKRGRFRTPSLRNVAVTAPYMHNGSLESLHEVLARHMPSDPEAVPGAGQSEDLIAFLRTLTDARGAARGLPRPRVTSCDTGGTEWTVGQSKGKARRAGTVMVQARKAR